MNLIRRNNAADLGLMIDNNRSPATPTGTAHEGGGNALYFQGHAKFLPGLCNPYNPGPGPEGYYVGYSVFRDFVDGR